MNKYVFFDNETGGIGLKYSLLTTYFTVTDENFIPIDSLDLTLKPDDGDYIVCGEAMRVNRIDLSTHDIGACTYKDAKPKLYDFLKRNSSAGNIKLIPCGQGIRGDIEQIIDKLISKGSWETFCSYRVFDTSVFAQGLKIAGIFPKEVSGSLSSMADYFGIVYDKNILHTASGDTLVTIKVAQKLIGLIKK